MKNTILLLTALAALSSLAAPTNKLTKAEREARWLQRSGGFINVAASGKFMVFDGQKRLPAGTVTAAMRDLCESLRIEGCRVESHSAFAIASAAQTMTASGATAAVFVVDDPSLPLALVASEDHWGLVNVAKLDANAKKLEDRFNKEFVRVMSIVLGAWSSQMTMSVLQPIKSTADLDRLSSASIGPDAILPMHNYCETIGFTQARQVTYRAACKQGWAPAPTNAIQQAIWDQVHAIPQSPMKIEFDPKKGR